jgi:D-alanyl-D-alanine carboxypeptidase
MNKKLPEVKKEKTLPDERYDEKLFKQAYKAGLEARELEKKQKRKKILLRIVAIVLTILVILSITVIFLSLRKEKIEYIESNSFPKQAKLVEITNLEDVSSPPLMITTENISAQSALVFDPSSGSVIYEKNSNERRPIASITKLLSVLVVLENFDIEESIEVSLENVPENLDWQLELMEGDRIKVDYLLKAMLLSSYNDTAYVIANAYPNGGYQGFIKAMNSKAASLRMEDSMFSNPAGIDSESNYSTAKDVGKLVSAVINNQYILDIVSKGSFNISWNSGNELKSKSIYTTNQLYGVNPYIKGLKTGITEDARQCFVGLFEYTNGSQLITVVLGSEDRFTDTANLERMSRGLSK